MTASYANPEYFPSAISATTQVSVSQGLLGSIFCSSSSSGTVTIYDSATAQTSQGAIVAQFSVSAATSYPLNIKIKSGIYIVIGGTTSITVLYN